MTNIIITNLVVVTNTINQTAISSMPVDGWVVFGSSISVGDIATVVSVIFMVITAGIMWCSVLETRKQNKISAQSIEDIKRESYLKKLLNEIDEFRLLQKQRHKLQIELSEFPDIKGSYIDFEVNDIIIKLNYLITPMNHI